MQIGRANEKRQVSPRGLRHGDQERVLPSYKSCENWKSVGVFESVVNPCISADNYSYTQ